MLEPGDDPAALAAIKACDRRLDIGACNHLAIEHEVGPQLGQRNLALGAVLDDGVEQQHPHAVAILRRQVDMGEVERLGLDLRMLAAAEDDLPGQREDRDEGDCDEERERDIREPLKAGFDRVDSGAEEGADVERRDLRDRRCLTGGRSRRRPGRFPHRDELRIDHVTAPHALIEGFNPAAGTVRRQEVEVRGSGLLLVTESTHACGPFAQPKSDTPKVGG